MSWTRTKVVNTWLAVETTVSVPQVVESRHGTINQSMENRRRKRNRPQAKRLKDSATVGKIQKIIVSHIGPDKLFRSCQIGAGGQTLRGKFWTRQAEIFQLELQTSGRDFFKSHSVWLVLDFLCFELEKNSKHTATRHSLSTMARTQARIIE